MVAFQGLLAQKQGRDLVRAATIMCALAAGGFSVATTAASAGGDPAYDHVYRQVDAIVLDIRFHDCAGILDESKSQAMRRTALDYLVRELGAIRPDIAIIEKNLAPRESVAGRRLETVIRVTIRKNGSDGSRPAVTVVGIESILRGIEARQEAQREALGIWRGTKTAIFERPDARMIENAVAAELKKQVKADIVAAYERYPRNY